MSNEIKLQNSGIALHDAAATAPAPAVTAPKTAEDIKAMVEAQLRSAYEGALAKPQKEIAEPGGIFAWDVLGFGPIQPGAGLFPFSGPPFLPNQVIRVGEQAYAISVLVFSPFFTATLTTFKLPVEITYSTGELKKWQLGPASLQFTTNTLHLIPGQPFLVHVFPFVADQEGLYEMNICARILDCEKSGTPPFSGFARRITKIEPVIFLPEQNVLFDTGMKFQVYK